MRGSEGQNRGTREDVMHNRLDSCQETNLMKVWGRGVTMEYSLVRSIQDEMQWSKLLASAGPSGRGGGLGLSKPVVAPLCSCSSALLLLSPFRCPFLNV